MKCPIDDSVLSVSSREGVEIDFCPQCRGVWLDRGELDKIIDRAATALGPGSATVGAAAGGDRWDARDDRDRDDRSRDDRGDRDGRPGDGRSGDDRDRGFDRKRKRRSFLDDLFDFD